MPTMRLISREEAQQTRTPKALGVRRQRMNQFDEYVQFLLDNPTEAVVFEELEECEDGMKSASGSPSRLRLSPNPWQQPPLAGGAKQPGNGAVWCRLLACSPQKRRGRSGPPTLAAMRVMATARGRSVTICSSSKEWPARTRTAPPIWAQQSGPASPS
jgi:hypothetical protein